MSTRKQSVKRSELFVTFLLTLTIVIVETAILMKNVSYIAFSSFNDLISSPTKFGIVSAYILSVILVPFTSIIGSDFVKKIHEMHRVHIVRSLSFETLSKVEKYAKLLPILILFSLFFVIVGVITKIYNLMLFSLIPFSIYMLVILKPVYNVYSHSKNIDREIQWLLILLIVIESVKANIKFLIDRLKAVPLLPSTTKELMVIDRDAKLYGLSYISALIIRSNVTPNNRFSDLLSGYASRLRTGGDVTGWLKSKLNEEIMLNEFNMRMYSERIATIFGQLMLAVYVIMPLLSVAILSINAYFVIVVSLIATPLFIALVYATQPKRLDILPIVQLTILPAMCMIAIAVAFYRILGPHSICLGWFFAIVLAFKNRDILKEVEILDRDSMEILRLMIELRQSGIGITKALEYIANSRAIHDLTARRLKQVIPMLNQGMSLVQISAKIQTHSFLFKFTLFTLGLVHECGGGDAEIFQTLYEYVGRVRTLRSSVEKVALFFDIFAFVNVFLVVWIWKSITPLYESFSMLGVLQYSLSPEALYLLIYVALIGYTLVSSTIRKGVPIFEPRNMVFLLVCVLPLLLLGIA